MHSFRGCDLAEASHSTGWVAVPKLRKARQVAATGSEGSLVLETPGPSFPVGSWVVKEQLLDTVKALRSAGSNSTLTHKVKLSCDPAHE